MAHSKRLRVSKLSLGLLVCLAAAPAFAQTLSSGVNGQVVGVDGRPVANQVVTIQHTETGTSTTVTTDANGRYSARGLRVGGPYTISTTGGSETGVYLNLDKVSEVNITTAGAGTQTATSVGTVRVTGNAALRNVFNKNKMGAGTNVNQATINAFPSIERSMQDYARMDPRVAQTDKARNEISVGGQNPRYNAIRVDGISTNDAFGLESNGLPTPKQPFSMDTIQEITVDVANYDVTINGGTGGVINAITKSGTNNFHGSVYGLYRDSDMVGKVDGNNFTGFEEDTTYGATFGGPILRDRLFFFLNYEKSEQTAAGPSFGPIGSGASNIVNIAPETIAALTAAAQAKGLTAGTSDFTGANTTAEEFGAKLDWNINDNHRAYLRFGKSDQSVAIQPGFGSSSISLNSYAYQRDFKFDTTSAGLFSNWTENFSTEFKASYRDYSAVRTPTSDAPAVSVRVPGTDGRTYTVNMGVEENTHANILETQTLNLGFIGNYRAGDHTVKFGADYENNDIYNLFGRRVNGVYRFDSIADFTAGESSFYQYFHPNGGNLDNMAAIWSLKKLGLFIQDTWEVTPNLTLNYGVRFDKPDIGHGPAYNAAADRAFGYDNSAMSLKGLMQPRFGFNYKMDTARPTQLRGGFGLFQGAAANVWLSNPFTNTGMSMYTDYQFRNGIDGFAATRDGQFALVANAPVGSGAQAVDFVKPDFEQPSIWKGNLAFDTQLPWYGILASMELIFTKNNSAIQYQHLNLGAPTGYGPDGRALFWGTTAPSNWRANGSAINNATRQNRNRDFTDVILATNSDKGNSQQLTFSLQKPFTRTSDWSWSTAYTYTRAREVSALTSSTSGSQWGNNNTFHPNENVLAPSMYEIPHRLTMALSWRHRFFGDYATTVSTFGEIRSGRNYSYVFDNDANGDGRFGNDLFYIPKGPGDVKFGTAAEEAAFWAMVGQDKYLQSNLGNVAKRGGARAPWVKNFDVRISQELPGFWTGHKSEIWLDMLNVGNMLNKDWGRIEEIGFPGSRGVAEFGGIDPATGKYVYRFDGADQLRLYDDRGVSRWALQVGFRYKF